MKFLFLILFILICIAACSSQPLDLSNVHNDSYVICKNKLDGSQLDYLKSNRHDYKSDLMPEVTISNIIDIHNSPWTINNIEWTQFSCTEKLLP